MIQTGLFIVLVLLIILVFKVKIAKNKEPQARSSVEKILVSMFVSVKKNVDDVAEQVRTPEISREECLQKIKEAINSLRSEYEKEMSSLIYHHKRLVEEVIPALKQKPGQYEGKARIWKKKSEEASKAGDQNLFKVAKDTSINFLSLKKNALDRIEKAEKQAREAESVRAIAEATYESRKAVLEDIQMEVETSLASNISSAKFSQSINMINALKRETADKLRKQNADIEASNLANNNETSISTDSVVNSGQYEEEFDKL